MFRKKYGLMGQLSYPFWFLFEWLAPIIEFLGTIYFVIMALLGWINWPHFYILLGLVYFYAILISFIALWIEEISYREYGSGKALLKLMLTALMEPIFIIQSLFGQRLKVILISLYLKRKAGVNNSERDLKQKVKFTYNILFT